MKGGHMPTEERGGAIIVSDDPVPPEMTQALCGFLARYPGTWRVRINMRLAGSWWSVTVSTEGFHRIFLLPPGEQTATGLMAQLRGTLGSADSSGPALPWDGQERRSRTRN
jgi:hypothetical protein